MAAPFPFVNHSPGQWPVAWRSSYKGGTSLMRLFRDNPPAQSEADRARDLRLTSIASRYRPRPEVPSEPRPEPNQ